MPLFDGAFNSPGGGVLGLLPFNDRWAPVAGAIGNQFQGDVQPGMGGLQNVSPAAMDAWRNGVDWSTNASAPRSVWGALPSPPASPTASTAPVQQQAPQPGPAGGAMPSALGSLPVPSNPLAGLFGGGGNSAGPGDRLYAGLMGFTQAKSPMGALGNLIGGIATGQRQDAVGGTQQAQQAALQYVSQAGDIDPVMRRALIASPDLALAYMSQRLKPTTSNGYLRATGVQGLSSAAGRQFA